jgi:hypothetical protein
VRAMQQRSDERSGDAGSYDGDLHV